MRTGNSHYKNVVNERARIKDIHYAHVTGRQILANPAGVHQSDVGAAGFKHYVGDQIANIGFIEVLAVQALLIAAYDLHDFRKRLLIVVVLSHNFRIRFKRRRIHGKKFAVVSVDFAAVAVQCQLQESQVGRLTIGLHD